MATVVPPRVAPSLAEKPRLSVGDELIARRIAEAQTALWRAELSRALLIAVIGGLVALVGWFVIDQWVWSPGPIGRLAALATGLAVAGWWLVTRLVPLAGRKIRADYAAQSLELDMPELRHALTSYVALRDDVERPGVRGAVVRSIGVRAAGQIKQHRLEIPTEATGILGWWIAVAVVLAAFAAYSLLSPKNTLQSAQRLFLPLAKIDPPTRVTIRDVQPGDSEMLADRELEVSAVIDQVAAQDEPVIRFGYGFGQSEPLQWDPSSGRHTAVVKISRSTRYRIEAGDATAGPFEIVARDVPVATVRSITITPPEYTRLPTRGLTGGAVSAEENSQVAVDVTTNRPVARGRIDFNPRTIGDDSGRSAARRSGATAGSVEMTVADDGMSLTGSFPVKLPRDGNAAVAIDSYAIRVWDAEENSNPDPIIYPVRIIPDLAPEVRFGLPRELVREVPINGQQRLEVSGLDPDYGLRKIELSLRRGADPVVVETLWSSAVGDRGNQFSEYRFRPAELGYRVGDKVLATARASDNREDVAGQPQPNRTETQPIELRIVAEQPLPPPTADTDGLSEPDDQPAAGQPDDQPSTEDGGEGESGQNGASGGRPSESESAGEDERGEDERGEDDRGDGESKPSDQSDPTRADDAKAGDGASEAGESGDTTATGDREQGAGDAGSPGQQESESAAADDSAGDDSGQTPMSEPADESATSGETASPRETDSSAEPSYGDTDAGPEASGSSTGGETDPATPSQPPQHDGDAFERIRDYLEQNRSSAESSPDESSAEPEEDAGEQKAADPSAGGADSEPEDSGQAADGDREADGDRDAEAERESDGQRESEGDQAGGGDAERGEDREGVGEEPAETPDAPQPTADRSSESADGGPEQPKSAADPTTSESGEPDSAGSEPPEGDSRSGEPMPDEQAVERQPSSAAEAAEADNGGASEGSEGEDSASAEGGLPNADEPSADEPSAERGGDTASDAQSSPGGGSAADAGDGQVAEGVGDTGSESVRPPDPVDLEYARQATDLVLDYLDQNRDTPDQELLDRLNWTPEELRDFTQRWRQTLQPTDDADSVDPRQVEEALKSLGIRKPTDRNIGETRDSADSLRGLRDGGNRPPPPSLYRDAFEAFRRGVGR